MSLNTAQSAFSLIHLILDSGERLPVIVHAQTLLPVRVATRWAIRYRRFQVQRSTLENNLRVLKKVYEWAYTICGLNLDAFLTQGQILNIRQLESLAHFLRTPSTSRSRKAQEDEDDECDGGEIIDAGYYDSCLHIVENFLKWSLDSFNRGGICLLSFEQLAARRTQLEATFSSFLIGATPSQVRDGLTADETEKICSTIGPRVNSEGRWIFPREIFSRRTCLRNYLMFMVSLETGCRRGELLKLRLDSLPRGSDQIIQIKRHPDDPQDSRTKEPAVKTAERIIPVSRNLLNALRLYLTLPSAEGGRVRGKSLYLFVTDSGEPLSLDRAEDIASKISDYSNVPFSWHMLRHTWAEKQAEQLFDHPNGLDKLRYLGGWTNSESPLRYIKRAIAKKAISDFQEYQSSLYPTHEEL